MERRTQMRLLIPAAIGILLLIGNAIVFYTSIEHQQLTPNRSIVPEQPYQLQFDRHPDERVEVALEFRQFFLNTVLQPDINGEQLSSFTNTSRRVIPIDTSLLERQNTLTVRITSGEGSSATLVSVTITKTPMTVRTIFLILSIVGVLLITGPYMAHKYMEFRRREELEAKFPEFLRDVVEGMRAGMSLPHAILAARDNEYGQLTPYIDDIAAKMEWGIPFDTIMSKFGKDTGSIHIQRAVNSIIQAHQTGGKISEVLEAIGINLREIRGLKQERKNQMYSEILTGYVIYIVFIFILISILKYLLPSLTFSGDIFTFGGGAKNLNVLLSDYTTLFRHLAVIQGIFSGLVIGKLSEGSFRAGGKHIVALALIGYFALVLFTG